MIKIIMDNKNKDYDDKDYHGYLPCIIKIVMVKGFETISLLPESSRIIIDHGSDLGHIKWR